MNKTVNPFSPAREGNVVSNEEFEVRRANALFDRWFRKQILAMKVPEEMAILGDAAPPYHPNCRCIIDD